MAPTELTLRPAAPAELPAVAELLIAARVAAYPSMPHGIHPPHEVREWVAGWDLATHAVWVAEAGSSIVGYARFDEVWLDDLYVDPAAQGAGVGSALLELVKAQRPAGFCLWVFESNAPARALYRGDWSNWSSLTARPTRRRPPTCGWPGQARIRSPSTGA
ncbi:MAG TPA: GNAT family N-acetyltransferase [Nocardioides sp.]|nr:GNAT family N-acetyltransferase [Nocardioides sp.]